MRNNIKGDQDLADIIKALALGKDRRNTSYKLRLLALRGRARRILL